MEFKLGFGPMSHMIVDIMLDYAGRNQRPLMIIASRNQVDVDSGYVMTTEQLRIKHSKKFNPYTILCRDHCGPYFLDRESSLSEADALEATKRTIANDIENGFRLIHIDTSRCANPYRAADILFDFTLSLLPTVWFEFGSEENVGVAAGIKKYMDDVVFASQYPNTKFVVAQTGSLTMEDRQVGTFEFDAVSRLTEYAENRGVRLKEHNADYLTSDQIKLRRQAGVHACNIAPQLGVIQTKTILKLADYYGVDSSEFKETVLQSNKWSKWMIGDDPEIKVKAAGHYCFNTPVYRHLEDQLNALGNVKLSVESQITACMDQYYNNLY